MTKRALTFDDADMASKPAEKPTDASGFGSVEWSRHAPLQLRHAQAIQEALDRSIGLNFSNSSVTAAGNQTVLAQADPLQSFVGARFKMLHAAAAATPDGFVVSVATAAVERLSKSDAKKWADAFGYDLVDDPSMERMLFRKPVTAKPVARDCEEFDPSDSSLSRCRNCSGAFRHHSKAALMRWMNKSSARGRRRI